MIRDDSGVIEHRYDTKENWTEANPILARGELGVEIEFGVAKLKVGDGITCWQELDYAAGGSGTGGIQYGTLTIGTTSTLSDGKAATVTNSGTSENAILNFGIPKGAAGKDGVTPNITINVSTGTAGSDVAVTKGGTLTEAVFAMEIPRGDKGEKGDPGKDGNGDVASNFENTFSETNSFNSTLKTTCDIQRYASQAGSALVLGYDSDNIQTLTIMNSSAEIRYSDTTSKMAGYKKTFIIDVLRTGSGVFSIASLNIVNGKTAALYIMDGTLPDIAVGELLKLGLEIDTERNAIFVHTLGKVAL